MSNEHTLRFEVVTIERTPAEVYAAGKIVYDALAVPKPRDKPVTMAQPNGVTSPATVELFVDVLADTDEDLHNAAAAAANAFRNFGLETVGDPELQASRSVSPPSVRTPGLTYDADTQHLTIEAWAPQWQDIELSIVSRLDGAIALIADNGEEGRREQGVPVQTITVRRPAGA